MTSPLRGAAGQIEDAVLRVGAHRVSMSGTRSLTEDDPRAVRPPGRVGAPDEDRRRLVAERAVQVEGGGPADHRVAAAAQHSGPDPGPPRGLLDAVDAAGEGHPAARQASRLLGAEPGGEALPAGEAPALCVGEGDEAGWWGGVASHARTVSRTDPARSGGTALCTAVAPRSHSAVLVCHSTTTAGRLSRSSRDEPRTGSAPAAAASRTPPHPAVLVRHSTRTAGRNLG
ncbi:hypothetical protein PROPJV5_1207 [Propionibacterium ruminifibrarum]|uniref:Uncharacterized protein n=1 Tax=Propionibacterium ruminifibrarum TaxID=1962131 RepID=A0A375I3H3_9ACTN|nr:hypothetical protein PROPJV5_1207 [Propionibacterium ruminifibrarum]